jgi:hypothetical protein
MKACRAITNCIDGGIDLRIGRDRPGLAALLQVNKKR